MIQISGFTRRLTASSTTDRIGLDGRCTLNICVDMSFLLVCYKNETMVACQPVFDIRQTYDIYPVILILPVLLLYPVLLILPVVLLQGCGRVRTQAGRHRQRQSVPPGGLQTGEHQPPEQVCSPVSITCASGEWGCHWNTSQPAIFIYMCFCRTLIPLFLVDLAVCFIPI